MQISYYNGLDDVIIDRVNGHICAAPNASNEAAVKLPPMGHIRRAIRNQREDNVAVIYQ